MLETILKSLKDAFEAEGADPASVTLDLCAVPELADFECKATFLAAKTLKQNPLDVAARIVAKLPPVAEFSVAGRGLINVKLPRIAVEQMVNQPVTIEKYSGRIVIDFGGPNVAKPMHVGHLRSLVIGDALQRLLRFVGYDVVSDIHLGDWGLQMGLLIVQLRNQYTKINKNSVTIEMLEQAYPAASARAKEDEQFRKEAQKATETLQSGVDSGARELWQHFIRISMVTIERELAALGVLFTHYRGESDVQGAIHSMVGEFLSKGIAKEDAGAVIVPLTDPPLILRNSEGAALYATTDLATIKERVREFAPDRIIYVVDQRQALHFQQVFTAADAIGYAPKSKLVHVGFGTVNGKDGKPLKTREGGVPKLHDLITAAIDKAAEKNPEAAQTVGVAALKFADLQNPRLSSYEFDLDRFLSFEGKTGPYLLYQCVRIKSILRNATATPEEIRITDDTERNLALKLVVGFPEAVRRAADKLSPKELVDHAYELAQTFSKFYTTHPIAQNGSRVALAMLVLEQLITCLDLLGIEVPEKM